ncbi:transcriptional regulator [Phocaeicola barnesiae]
MESIPVENQTVLSENQNLQKENPVDITDNHPQEKAEDQDRPKVTIELKPILQDFLYHEFQCHKGTDEVIIDGDNPIGQFIQSMVSVSDRPRKQPAKEHMMTLILPVQSWNHALLRENFLFIPVWRQEQIQLYVEAQFRLRIKEYFFVGYSKKYPQDKIVSAFLEHYNIKFNQCNYETIKKYDYRNRRRIYRQIDQEIQEDVRKNV